MCLSDIALRAAKRQNEAWQVAHVTDGGGIIAIAYADGAQSRAGWIGRATVRCALRVPVESMASNTNGEGVIGTDYKEMRYGRDTTRQN
jgi:hypothetical protein